MTDRRAGPVRLLDAALHGPRAARLILLMLASALTEGIGLILLVPLLGLIGGGDTGGAGLAAELGKRLPLGAILAAFVALVVLRGVINLARNLAALKLETDVVDALRKRAWHALLHCDWRQLTTLRRSQTVSLLVTSIDRVGVGLNQLLAASAAFVTLFGLGLAAFALSPSIALAGLAGGMVILTAYHGLRRRAAEHGEALSHSFADVHGCLSDGVAALRVIKSLDAEGPAETRVVSGFAALAAARLRFLRDLALGQLVLQAGAGIVLAALVWLAVTRWHLSALTLLPFIALFARAVPLLGALQETWQHWSHARPAVAATLGLIERAEAAREADAGEVAALPAPRTGLELRAVTVHFAGELRAALDGVSIAIPARGMVALVGPSGSGKSTLADVAGGLLAPDEGEVRVDGVALDAGRRRAWRRRVAYVQQDPVLLAGTVRENLMWGAPKADAAAIAAALADAAAQFVHALPRGLDTPLGDGGRALSGGERQRIMLARALLRDPALLILDEATSALDPASEALVADAIMRLKTRMAILAIAHRGALIDLADHVVTLEAGQIRAISGA